MLTCKQATRILSEAQDRPLSVGERLSITFHLWMCKACHNFSRQMTFLRAACRRYPAAGSAPSKREPADS